MFVQKKRGSVAVGHPFSLIRSIYVIAVSTFYRQCMPIIFMTHRSFSVILSSHIENPSQFASVMTSVLGFNYPLPEVSEN